MREKNINIRIDATLHKALRRKCLEEDIHMSVKVRQLIAAYLEEGKEND